jgi:hypothetical protein
MKKVFIPILPIVLFMGVANAQLDSCVQNTNLKRKKIRLAFDTLNSSVLEKGELQILLSDKQFKTYNHARSCYVASIPLYVLAGCGAAITTTSIGMGIYYHFLGEFDTRGMAGVCYFIAGCTFAGTLAPLIPAIILNIYGKKQLDKLALDYNNQRYSSYYQRNIQLNFGFTQNGIGFKLSF